MSNKRNTEKLRKPYLHKFIQLKKIETTIKINRLDMAYITGNITQNYSNNFHREKKIRSNEPIAFVNINETFQQTERKKMYTYKRTEP